MTLPCSLAPTSRASRDVGGQVARGGARSADLRHLDVSPPILGVQLGEAAGWVGHRLEADGVDDMARERVAALLVGGEVVRAERLASLRVVVPVDGVNGHSVSQVQDDDDDVGHRGSADEIAVLVQLAQFVDADLDRLGRAVLAEGGEDARLAVVERGLGLADVGCSTLVRARSVDVRRICELRRGVHARTPPGTSPSRCCSHVA